MKIPNERNSKFLKLTFRHKQKLRYYLSIYANMRLPEREVLFTKLFLNWRSCGHDGG